MNCKIGWTDLIDARSISNINLLFSDLAESDDIPRVTIASSESVSEATGDI